MALPVTVFIYVTSTLALPHSLSGIPHVVAMSFFYLVFSIALFQAVNLVGLHGLGPLGVGWCGPGFCSRPLFSVFSSLTRSPFLLPLFYLSFAILSSQPDYSLNVACAHEYVFVVVWPHRVWGGRCGNMSISIKSLLVPRELL